MVEVFSSGGGTQSNCIASLIIQGKLPKPDLAVIADTGRECGTTWQYLNAVTLPALAGVGVEIHRVCCDEWGGHYAKDPNWLDPSGKTMILPTWTDETGNVGKMPGFCSSKWKNRVIQSFLSKTFGLTRSKVKMWIGFSMDETRRALRMMAGPEWEKGLIRFPMIHDVPMKRHHGIREVEKMGWPKPPRSRCWMCPNQADDEWKDLKENAPDEFAQAVAFEREMQAFDPCAWLHRSCTPLDQVDFTAEPTLFDAGGYCSSGMCFV